MSGTNGGWKAQELAERALELSAADGAVVLVEESSTANLRWASNTLTTNGVAQNRRVTVISVVDGEGGRSAAVVSKAGVGAEDLPDLVRAAERAARQTGPAPDAQPLVGASEAAGSAGAALAAKAWSDEPARTSIDAFAGFTPQLGEAFRRAGAENRLLFGFAEHTVSSTYLATSAGVRLKHDQPTGKLELNAKSPDFARSAWAGAQGREFGAMDVVAMDAELTRRLAWQERRVDLPAGRYETLMPASAVADLYVYMMWIASARDAADGRTVFSSPGGGTKVGTRIGPEGLRIWSDPSAPGLECTPFNEAHTSDSSQSVFDNGLPLAETDWVRDGVLERLRTTRHSAAQTGLPLAPPVDNLLMDAGGQASLEELTARTERGLLLTCLWYIREVDPQSLLLTGLTRDGVYLVEGGEVTGVVNNFRFNESPVDLLGRIVEAGRPEQCLPREWGDYFTRACVPPLHVADFNMSSVSKAN
jgi:predicted Zn-dependent protease